MIDAGDIENDARQEASREAGAYIDSLASTDMATWSHEEWENLITVICEAYTMGIVKTRFAAQAAIEKISMV